MSVRRLIAALVIVVAAATGGYTAYWFHAVGLMRKGVEDWAATRRSQGWEVEWATATGEGFPLHLGLALAAPHLQTPDGLWWRGDTLMLDCSPFDWTRLRAAAPGHHQGGQKGLELSLDASGAHADINLDRQGGLEDATLYLTGLRLSGPFPDALTMDGMVLTWDPLPVTGQSSHTTPTVRFSATAHGIALPALPTLPLDRSIGLVELSGHILGTLPMANPAEAVTRWSADGGTVELDHVGVEWAPMALEAQGTLALDPARQPLASLTARIRGFGPLMDRLVAAHMVPADTASTVKTVLALMAKPDPKGRPAVPVPVTLQDGGLYLGPARVARLPPLAW